MNRLELRELVKFILNFNELQTDQDFTNDEIHTALDQAYNEEICGLQEEGNFRYWVATTTFTWTSGEATKTLPEDIKDGGLILRIADVTNYEPGNTLQFSDFGQYTDVYFRDRNTLAWGEDGPSETKTFRVQYIQTASSLVTDGSEPQLLPYQYHDVVAWAAAIWLRTVAEDEVPLDWIRKLEGKRRSLLSFVTRGRPASDVPQIKNTNRTDVGYSLGV